MSAELIARLEAADGGWREIDVEIWDAIEAWPVHPELLTWRRAPNGNYVGAYVFAPAYTLSLDAALALTQKLGFTSWTIEPDAAWVKWMHDGDVKQACHVFFGRGGSSTALALCIAALKARAERNPETETKP